MFTQVWRNWQTRTVQVRVKAISCRFDSCYLHQNKMDRPQVGPFFLHLIRQESNLEKARTLRKGPAGL